jgi:hypothetical protein
VRVSVKTDYAVRAMIELAGATEERPVAGEQIVGAQEIPLRFLGRPAFGGPRGRGRPLAASRAAGERGKAIHRPLLPFSTILVFR